MSILDKLKGKINNISSTGGNVNMVTAVGETAADIIKRLSGGEVRHERKLIENVVLFTGAAGGTGASTVASNVAYMASKRGMRVLVIDLNIMLPVQHSYFDIKQEIEKKDLVTFLSGYSSLGESIVTKGNISVLVSNNRNLMDHVNMESDSALANFNSGLDRVRQLYDIVIIDSPLKIENALVNTAMYSCDKIYMVWDEGISSIANAERIRRNMAFTGIEAYSKVKAILNKRTNIHYSGYHFEKLGIELLGILPFDPQIIDSSLRAQVFCDKAESKEYNSTRFYSGISDITEKILDIGGWVDTKSHIKSTNITDSLDRDTDEEPEVYTETDEGVDLSNIVNADEVGGY